MPLYIKDDATAELVAQRARKRGVSKQEAVRAAVEAELDRIAEAIPLRERIATWRKEHPDAATDGPGSRQTVLR